MSKINDWHEFISVEKTIQNSFLQFIVNSKNEDYNNLIKIAFRKTIDISNAIITWQDENYFSQKGKFHSIIISHFGSIKKTEPVISYQNELKIESQLRLRLKCIKYFVKLNLNRIPLLQQKKIYIIIEGFNPIILSKLNDYGMIIPISSKLRIRKLKHAPIVIESNIIESFCFELGKSVYNSLIEHHSKLKVDSIRISNLIYEHISEFVNDYYSLLKTKLPNRIALGTHNKSFLRLFSAVVLNKGGEVISCAHGHHLQNKDYHKLWMDIILSTSYYEFNNQLAKELDLLIKQSEYSSLTNCQIKSIEINKPYLFKKIADYDSSKINSILLIGNSAKLKGYSSVTSFLPEVQFEIELSILNYFHEKGKTVHYKLHPEGKLKSKTVELMKTFSFINIVEDPFESIIDKYDLIVFYYTKTTTINAALNSQKHILLIDLGLEELCSESNSILKKRCEIINYEELCLV